jgi:hypothetical protein
MSGNVIDFNAAKLKKMQDRFDDKMQDGFDDIVEEQLSEEDMITGFAYMVVCDVIEVMSDIGYNVRDNPDTMKDIVTSVESIRGLLHRAKGTEYPFHKISDSFFDKMFYGARDPSELLEKFIEKMKLEVD